jgi:hypothetical protein
MTQSEDAQFMPCDCGREHFDPVYCCQLHNSHEAIYNRGIAHGRKAAEQRIWEEVVAEGIRHLDTLKRIIFGEGEK